MFESQVSHVTVHDTKLHTCQALTSCHGRWKYNHIVVLLRCEMYAGQPADDAALCIFPDRFEAVMT